MAPPLFPNRSQPDVLCLFDVDGTLTPARQDVSADMVVLLGKVRKHCAIGFVGGSDFAKIKGQLQLPGLPDGERYRPDMLFGSMQGQTNELTHLFSQGSVRLLLCRERSDGVSDGQAAGLAILYWLDRRGKVQGDGQIHFAVHQRSGSPNHAVGGVRRDG